MDDHAQGDPAGPGRSSLSRRSSAGPIVVGLLVVLSLVGAWLWRSGAFDRGAALQAAATDAGAVSGGPSVANDAGLDVATGESLLRKLLAGLSPAPEWARWLSEPNLISRVVAAVDLVAQGDSPRPVLGFLAPAGPFAVESAGGALHTAPKSHARYDTLTHVVTAVDPAGLGKAYGELAPYLRAAFKGIAPPGASFDARLHAAIAKLTATPVLETDPALQDGDHGYTYLDPKLEALPPAQKHLLRMGPANARALTAWLTALDHALPAP